MYIYIYTTHVWIVLYMKIMVGLYLYTSTVRGEITTLHIYLSTKNVTYSCPSPAARYRWDDRSHWTCASELSQGNRDRCIFNHH